MKKGKYIFILLTIMTIFTFTNAYALSKNEMTVLNLKKEKSYVRPKGYTSTQGGTTTDKYVISIFLKHSKKYNKKNSILVLNKKNYRKVELTHNPIMKYNFGHANDATYNSRTNELLVVNRNKIHILNATSLKLKKTVRLKKKFHAIGYDLTSNQYVLASTASSGVRIHIMNTNFKQKSSFIIKTNLTKQGLTVYNGNVYYCGYETGKVTRNQKKYDRVLKRGENAIYVYNLKGKKKNIYYIPYMYNKKRYGKIENISFNGNKMLLQFHKNGKIYYYTPKDNKIITKLITKTNNKTAEIEESTFLDNNSDNNDHNIGNDNTEYENDSISLNNDNSQSNNNVESRYGVFLGLDHTSGLSKLYNYKLVVIDLQEFTKSDIEKLHKKGIKVYSYLNIGSVEEYRSYFKKYKSIYLGKYKNWEDERWVDVSNKTFQKFIINKLEPSLRSKGADGYFIDNCDVYANFKKDKIYKGLKKILKSIHKNDLTILINGGDEFVTRAINEGTYNSLFDGVNQEEVFTSINFDNYTYHTQKKSETKYYKKYLSKVKTKNLQVYLLEYGANSKKQHEIKSYCLSNGFSYYNSKSYNLD